MNNFSLGIVMLIFMFSYYILIGSFVLSKVHIRRNKFAVYIIVGWGITFGLGWIIGFPSQLFSQSWYFFSKIYALVLIVVGFMAIVINKDIYNNKVRKMINSLKDNPKVLFKYVVDHLSKYWFIYLLAIVFTCFSITNLQSYTLNNYTDDHYITAMIQNHRSVRLFQESRISGQILKQYGKFSLAIQQKQHMFNTYELVYAFFSNLLNLEIVTFCRFTMTIHNYLLWFFSMQLLGSIFIDNKKSQYTIALLIVLLIPEGYAARGVKIFVIRIYENWRNQTAMYMGGSIVRNLAFPLLLYFSNLFYREKSFITFFLLPIIALELFSYHTMAISYIILFIPIFIVGFVLNIIWSNTKYERDYINKILVKASITSVVIIVLLFLIFNIDNVVKHIDITFNKNLMNGIRINAAYLMKIYKMYIPYYNNLFKLDFFSKAAILFFVIVLVFAKDMSSRIISVRVVNK